MTATPSARLQYRSNPCRSRTSAAALDQPTTSLPHQPTPPHSAGFCCSGGRLITIPQPHPPGTDLKSAAARSPPGTEVAPGLTAHRVWPGAYLLASSLSQPALAARVRGGRVIELGAGSGVPGLVAWTLGAAEVCVRNGWDPMGSLGAGSRSAGGIPLSVSRDPLALGRVRREGSHLASPGIPWRWVAFGGRDPT